MIVMEKEIRREDTNPKEESNEEKDEPKKEDEGTEQEAKEDEQSGIVEKKPWTKWTKEERIQHLKNKKYGSKEKWFVMLLTVIMLIAFLAGVIYSIVYQMDPALITIMIALFIATFIVGIFFTNHMWYESD
jgi:cation transport ATPase